MLRQRDGAQGGRLGGQRQQGFVAVRASSGFGAFALGMGGLHAPHAQGHAQALAEGGAVAFKGAGRFLQAVIDVQRHHLPRL